MGRKKNFTTLTRLAMSVILAKRGKNVFLKVEGKRKKIVYNM
jgi:hypothetical protein